MDTYSTPFSLPTQPRKLGFFIDGQFFDAGGRETFQRCSPAHDVVVTHTTMCSPEDVNQAVAAAKSAFHDGCWSDLSSEKRASLLLRCAQIIQSRQEEIAYWETLETGKPISQSLGEMKSAADLFEYAAGVARVLHGDSFNNLGEKMFGLVTREPIGVVGLIVPWNFPFYILSERIPFILAAGCTIVAKPSEFTSATSLIMAEILAEAGLPSGCFNIVTGLGETVGQQISKHPDIDMISFTGSTAVGKLCIQAAAGNFKKVSLELGGKNPHIVCADANLEDAADAVVFGIGYNGGQCCVSGSRLIVEQSIAREFENLIAEKMSKIILGDPLDPRVLIGAITTPAQNEAILRYIKTGQSEGAQLVCGGKALNYGKGQFIEPTLFSKVGKNMTIAKEEIFGPVLSVFPYETIEQAITMANNTHYGLSASVWTTKIDQALILMRKIKAGRFWINTTLAGGPEMPIGGFKQSGWGRECGIYGVEEYTQLKSVHIEIGARDHWIK